MPTGRAGAAHVVLSGRLYVLGGCDDRGENFKSVDCYNPCTDRWQTVAPMHYGRTLPAVCVANGFIYALGGTERGQPLDSVERYNPDDNSWTEVFIYLSDSIDWNERNFLIPIHF